MGIRKVFDVNDFVAVLIKILEAKDRVTGGHSIRVGYYAQQIGKMMGLSAAECENLRIAGALHDIGKVGIPDAILKKPGTLTPEEYEAVKVHPDIGYAILNKNPVLKRYAVAARDHHLRPNGLGYPQNHSSGRQYKDWREVDLMTRVVTVADVYDVMWVGRTYSPRKPLYAIVAELKSYTDKQFDPDVVAYMIQYLIQRFGEDALLSPEELAEKRKKAA